MKIVCESCGAKYSIADERVAGKMFKIRCKKCSAVIVVRGDQQPEESTGEATKVFDYASEPIWHVVVEGEQRGPISPRDIANLLANEEITWEAFVWREGFEDWQPAKDVEQLVQAVMAESEGGTPAQSAAMTAPVDAPAQAAMPAEAALAEAAAEPVTAQAEAPQATVQFNEPEAMPASQNPVLAATEDPYGTGEIFGDSEGMGEDPFATESFATSPEPGQPTVEDGGLGSVVDVPQHDGGDAALDSIEPAAASAAGGSADLFASADAAPDFSGTDEAAASEAGGDGAEQSMTGQRNENSVLFSLSNLQALATDSGSTGGAAAQSKPGMATGEGSGLIDIRALASASQTIKDDEHKKVAEQSVDDLLAVSGSLNTAEEGSFGNLAQAQTPAETGGGRGLMIGIAAAVVVLLVVVAGLSMRQSEPAPITATAAAVPTPVSGTPTAEAGEATKEPTGDPAEAAPQEPAGGTAADAPSDKAEASAPTRSTKTTSRSARRKSSRPRSRSAATSSAAKTSVDDILGPPKRSQSKAKTASKSGSGGSKSLDSLIDDIVGGPSKATKKRKTKAKATKSTASLPAGPSRGDVVKAMKRVAGRAKRCGSGKKGTAMVKLVVAGSTGRVKNAQVTNSPFRGTKEGSCIAREVRKARLPKFKKASMTITYPFKI